MLTFIPNGEGLCPGLIDCKIETIVQRITNCSIALQISYTQVAHIKDSSCSVFTYYSAGRLLDSAYFVKWVALLVEFVCLIGCIVPYYSLNLSYVLMLVFVHEDFADTYPLWSWASSSKKAYGGEKASFLIFTMLFLLHNGSMISTFPWCQIVSGLQLLYKELSESLYLLASYQAVVLVHLQLIWVKTHTFLMFVWVCSMESQGATSTSILTALPRNVQSLISGMNWRWPTWGHEKSKKYKSWRIWMYFQYFLCRTWSE